MSSSKRAAVSDLNHDNWNDEEEGEDAGEFKKASENELLRRVRKVAKRRGAVDSENTPNVNPFSGFGGFKSSGGISASSPAENSSPFSFLAKLPSAVAPPPVKTNGTTASSDKSNSQIEYLSKIKALNRAVADWIKGNVDENPLCILTPIFEDYEQYLKEFEELKKKKSEENNFNKPKESEPKLTPLPASTFSFGKPSIPPSPTSSSSSNTTNSNSVFNSFKFGDQTKPATTSPLKPAENKGITFGSGLSTESKGITFASASNENKGITFGSASPENKGISFGSAATENKGITFGTKPPQSTFSFGLQTPLGGATSGSSLFGGLSSSTSSFSFGSVVGPPKADAPKAEEDAEEEPPKNEFVPVVEDDSLYSKRCKVFVKGAADYNDRGVGTLYIKKVDDKIQMIVRADTNLGNIIFNIMIVDGLPVSRMGKNNVMVVCIPTPDAKPPPTSVLLRVKTGEDADELLNTINKYKK